MATIKCAISGITFRCDHLPITVSNNAGYFHPVFALPYKNLLGLYSKHCQNHLTPTDSYLLFCALLHSTGKVTWKQPASCNPKEQTTIKMIENNISQLIKVIEMTNAITIPSFRQPSFVVDIDNSKLLQIHNWIKAWKLNIISFREGYRQNILDKRLEKVEKKLTYLIVSGIDTIHYISVIADWADKTAEFPKSKADYWKRIIRSCFNTAKMFSIPVSDLKELTAYCEDNIEPGSVHSHKLFSVLREGINRNTNYLGMNPSVLGYTLLPVDTSTNDIELAAIADKATVEPPNRSDYSSDFEYLKAKLRYRVAVSNTAKITITNKEAI